MSNYERDANLDFQSLCLELCKIFAFSINLGEDQHRLNSTASPFVDLHQSTKFLFREARSPETCLIVA